MACLRVRERDATEVAKELATSLAPCDGQSLCQTSVSFAKKNSEHTNVPCVKERKDGGYGEDIIELRKAGHFDGSCPVKGPGGLAVVVVCRVTGVRSERLKVLYITSNLCHMQVSP